MNLFVQTAKDLIKIDWVLFGGEKDSELVLRLKWGLGSLLMFGLGIYCADQLVTIALFKIFPLNAKNSLISCQFIEILQISLPIEC